jgi:hypothetical protein
VQSEKELLPRDLGREAAQGRVGDLVGRIVPRPARHMLRQPRLEVADAVAGERR